MTHQKQTEGSIKDVVLVHTHRPMNHAIVGYFHRGGYSPMHFVGNRSNELEFLQHDHSTIR
jgi:hypothetical protein